MSANTMSEVRWERGGQVQWRYTTPSGRPTRWFRNVETKPQSEDDVRKAFADAGAPLAESARVREGRIEVCPRCNGTGRWVNGGLCFRCYGGSPARWIFEVSS
jgi:hypothetical protein